MLLLILHFSLKVCQMLMQRKVFKNATSDSSNQFEDSSSKFYQFIGEHAVLNERTQGEEDKENEDCEKVNCLKAGATISAHDTDTAR